MDSNDFKTICKIWANIMAQNSMYLTELDSVAGDGDIGIVMSDGFAMVAEIIQESDQTDIGMLIFQCGEVLSVAAPSSMGTLLATGFMRAGKALKGKIELDVGEIADMMQNIADGIMSMGEAEEGDKTALDSLLPGIRALRENRDQPIHTALKVATAAAEQGFENTRNMIAKHGRIAFRGEDSLTIADPGAAVILLIYRGMETVFSVQK